MGQGIVATLRTNAIGGAILVAPVYVGGHDELGLLWEELILTFQIW